MADMQRFNKARFLLGLAYDEIAQMEPERHNMQESLDSLIEIIGKVDKVYFAGPSDFVPGPTYEKCDKCEYYRLKK